MGGRHRYFEKIALGRHQVTCFGQQAGEGGQQDGGLLVGPLLAIVGRGRTESSRDLVGEKNGLVEPALRCEHQRTVGLDDGLGHLAACATCQICGRVHQEGGLVEPALRGGEEQLASRGGEPTLEWLVGQREPVQVQGGPIPLTEQHIGVGEGAMEPVRTAQFVFRCSVAHRAEPPLEPRHRRRGSAPTLE